MERSPHKPRPLTFSVQNLTAIPPSKINLLTHGAASKWDERRPNFLKSKFLIMEYPKITFCPDSKESNQYAYFGDEDTPSNWFTFIDSNEEHIPEDYARRLCAAWNYCAGVPTHELESQGADAGFWGRACSRLERKNDKLQDENARLRAAVTEMERMLPVLEYVANNMPGFVSSSTQTIGVTTLNAYKQALENAKQK